MQKARKVNLLYNLKSHGYEGGEIIGAGGWGKVYACRKIESADWDLALKVVEFSASELEIDGILNDIEILRKLEHRYIIKYVDSFKPNEQTICIVMERATTDLKESILIKKGSNEKLSENECLKYFSQMVQAMAYIHSKNVIHRDIKPENILIGADGNVKICDFGVSRQFSNYSIMTFRKAGTNNYMPPEMLEEKGYDHSADVWSCAIVLLEMICGTGRLVFQGTD